VSQLNQLQIDECIEWILHSIEFKKNFNYKYASGEGWEFLIFGADDYYLDTRALTKIEKTTGMILVQIKSFEGKADLWFGRKIETVQGNIKDRLV
jgi:hypothetical protein